VSRCSVTRVLEKEKIIVVIRRVLALLGVLAATATSAVVQPPVGRAQGAVTVTAVTAEQSSAKIDFLPVPGARDYRVVDMAAPTVVKYGGMLHLDAGVAYHFVTQADGVTPVFPYTTTADWRGGVGPDTLDVPSTEIQWNPSDAASHTLVVQAMDALGPVPPHNLTDSANNPINPPADMPGSNHGPTPDGMNSTNGQGDPTTMPRVLAQSAPFVVHADPTRRALPSRPDAVQTFFDTFDNAEAASLQQVGPVDARNGVMSYTLNAGTPTAWDVLYHGADTDHSMPMIAAGHFMDVLYNGITPSSLPPTGYSSVYHVAYSNMSLSPQTPADLSGGKLLHLTQEVDGHLDQTFRWLAWQLAPATDPITNFHADDRMTGGFQPTANTLPMNRSDQALWLQVFPQLCDMTLFSGPHSSINPAPVTNEFVPSQYGGSVPPCYRTTHFGGSGIGLDNRQRFDIFLTRRHAALFEDGQLITQADIPGGLPFAQAKLYFTHYVYATADIAEGRHLRASAPYETYWLNYFPHSDERHWDNMGFEVLPASVVPANGDFSSLGSLINMPTSAAPVQAGS